jgi:hypothetical protein
MLTFGSGRQQVLEEIDSGRDYNFALSASNASDDDSISDADIVVVGIREKTDATPYNRLVANGGGDWPSFGNMINWVAEKFRDLLDQRTDIEADSTFDQHHKDLIATAISKVSSSKEFKQAFADQQSKDLKINITNVITPSAINGDAAHTTGKNADGTVNNGATLTIQLTTTYGGEPISDKAFVTQVIHELIHTFGNQAWDIRLDTTNWDKTIESTLFADQLSKSDQSIVSDITPVLFSNQGGGTIIGSNTKEILVGSTSADIFMPGNGGNTVFSGGGDDTINLALGGSFDTIQDDSGSDAIILPSGTSIASVSTSWSPDAKDLSIWVSGNLEAIIADASTYGSIEFINIDGVNYSTLSLTPTTNATPIGSSEVFEIMGTYQGLVGNLTAYDANGDTVHYRLSSMSGAYNDQNWTVTDNGQIFANFMRNDQPGSEFTFLTLIASDNVSASEFDVTVRWASASDPGPILRNAFVSDSRASDNSTELYNMYNEANFHPLPYVDLF